MIRRIVEAFSESVLDYLRSPSGPKHKPFSLICAKCGHHTKIENALVQNLCAGCGVPLRGENVDRSHEI